MLIYHSQNNEISEQETLFTWLKISTFYSSTPEKKMGNEVLAFKIYKLVIKKIKHIICVHDWEREKIQ